LLSVKERIYPDSTHPLSSNTTKENLRGHLLDFTD
jgi:hypothetical protein